MLCRYAAQDLDDSFEYVFEVGGLDRIPHTVGGFVVKPPEID